MRYQWQNETSAIQEVRFFTAKKAAPEAVIFASPRAHDPNLPNLDLLLAKQGMTVSYDIIENRPALRVGGFTNEQAILDVLQKHKLVEGTPQKSEMKGEKQGFDRLTGAAVFYMLGNVTGLIGSWFRKDRAEVFSNSAFIAGDSTMLLFGKKSGKEKQHQIMQGFGELLRKNGVTVEPSSLFAQEHIQNSPGLWNGIRRFMADKVILLKSISEITAGIKKFESGLNQNNAYKKVAGAALTIGFTSGLAIPEKTPAQLRDEYNVSNNSELKDKLHKLPLGKRIFTTIQRWPLILSGSFAGLNNLSCIIGAISEYLYNKKTSLLGAPTTRQRDKISAELGLDENKNITKPEYTYTIFGWERKATLKKEQAIPAREKALEKLKEAKEKFPPESVEVRTATVELGQTEKRILDLEKEREDAIGGRFPKILQPKHFWLFDLVQGLFFLAANTLYGISPKGGSLSDRQKLSDRFFAAAASEIAKAPEEKKEYIFGIACQYAGSTRDLGVTSREAQGILAQKIQMLEANPWLRHRNAMPALDKSAEIPQELLAQPVEERPDRPTGVQAFTGRVEPHKDPVSRLTDGWGVLAKAGDFITPGVI